LYVAVMNDERNAADGCFSTAPLMLILCAAAQRVVVQEEIVRVSLTD
jgi:hypothetical protein